MQINRPVAHMDTWRRDLGKDLMERIIAYHAKPADIALGLLAPFRKRPDRPKNVDQLLYLNLIQISLDYLEDPDSKRMTNIYMRVPYAPFDTPFGNSSYEKSILLDSIKTRMLELRKQDYNNSALIELGKTLIEIPIYRSVFYNTPLSLSQAVNNHFMDRGTIFNGSLGVSLSKHLDLMELHGVPPKIVSRVLAELASADSN